jgi:1,4-dihydroxy-2-naphthoate octaprenyltransferase
LHTNKVTNENGGVNIMVRLIYFLGILILLVSLFIHRNKGWTIYGIGAVTMIVGWLL